MSFTNRAAKCAAKSDPGLNFHFRRAWGLGGATGPEPRTSPRLARRRPSATTSLVASAAPR